MTRVVITGVGMINAVGHSAEEAFNAIINGESGVNEITLFDASNQKVRIAAEVKNFNPESVMNKKEIKKADRFIQLGLHAAKEAIKDSNLLEEVKDSFGISAASGIGGLPQIEKNSIVCESRGPTKVSPFFIPSALANMLGGFVSIEHGLKGPNLASVTACTAGLHAIIEATKTIMLGDAPGMVVVGGESTITAVGVAGFASMKALSTRNEEPQIASRPFDKDRDGFILGEGAGSLVLEELSHALKRGAKIYGEVIGYGESSDAYHITMPAPEGDGAYRAMKAAMSKANFPKIDYINAHGTSTYYNDLYETMAIKKLFQDESYIPPVSSTKGQTGHCLGAAGVIEAIVALKAMEKSTIPPTINHDGVDEACSLDYVPNKSREKILNTVMSCNYGFGGTNGSIIFQKYNKNND